MKGKCVLPARMKMLTLEKTAFGVQTNEFDGGVWHREPFQNKNDLHLHVLKRGFDMTIDEVENIFEGNKT